MNTVLRPLCLFSLLGIAAAMPTNVLAQTDSLTCNYQVKPNVRLACDPKKVETLDGIRTVYVLTCRASCDLKSENLTECAGKYYPNNRKCGDKVRFEDTLAVVATEAGCADLATNPAVTGSVQGKRLTDCFDPRRTYYQACPETETDNASCEPKPVVSPPPTPAPSATPTRTPTPSPTRSRTPTAIPTRTPTPLPTVTPTRVPTATATPVRKPSPTPTTKRNSQ